MSKRFTKNKGLSLLIVLTIIFGVLYIIDETVDNETVNRVVATLVIMGVISYIGWINISIIKLKEEVIKLNRKVDKLEKKQVKYKEINK